MPKSDRESLSVALAQLIHDAGGRVVGRTRLQKMACLLDIAGYHKGFEFEYRHFGPYSELLYDVSKFAAAEGKIDEEEKQTNWGGWYSIFEAHGVGSGDAGQIALARKMVDADLIQLELAVTAAFLAYQGEEHPWEETTARKANKATPDRLEAAKEFYRELRVTYATPDPLPQIA